MRVKRVQPKGKGLKGLRSGIIRGLRFDFRACALGGPEPVWRRQWRWQGRRFSEPIYVMKQMLTDSTLIYLLLGFLGVVAVACFIWLWFIVARPARWSQLVDKENDFWVGKGLVSASASAWFRRFEKGPGQKLLVGLVGLLGATGFIGLAYKFWHQSHGG